MLRSDFSFEVHGANEWNFETASCARQSDLLPPCLKSFSDRRGVAIGKEQKHCRDIDNYAEPEFYQETDLAAFMPESSLGSQCTGPSAEEFPEMETFLRYAPILVSGKIFVFPIKQESQQAVHGIGGTHAANQVARFGCGNKGWNDPEGPEPGKSSQNGMMDWSAPFLIQNRLESLLGSETSLVIRRQLVVEFFSDPGPSGEWLERFDMQEDFFRVIIRRDKAVSPFIVPFGENAMRPDESAVFRRNLPDAFPPVSCHYTVSPAT